MPKSIDLNRSLEIKVICTFDTEFPTFLNKRCTYVRQTDRQIHLLNQYVTDCFDRNKYDER